MFPLTLIGKTMAATLLGVVMLGPAPRTPAPHAPVPRAPFASSLGEPASANKVYGTVQSLTGNVLVIRTRTGRLLTVDGQLAHSSVFLSHDRPVIVFGTIDARGVMHASAVWRTFPDAAHWPADR